jgi:hypothetical protein
VVHTLSIPASFPDNIYGASISGIAVSENTVHIQQFQFFNATAHGIGIECNPAAYYLIRQFPGIDNPLDRPPACFENLA